MAAILRRATDQSESEWRNVPEGLWRWIIGAPDLKISEKFGSYQVKFPLTLTTAEQGRLLNDLGAPPDGILQSYRTSYTTGLSLGYVMRDGQYKSTKLIDFLAAALGHENARKFREWVASGGGPPRPDDRDDQRAELELIRDWLRWWDNLEILGTVSHAADSQVAGRMWARFAGPLAVGSLPGEKDADYQAFGRGKLRAIIVQSHPELTGQMIPVVARTKTTAVVVTAEKPPAQRFTQDGLLAGEDEDELPF